MVKVAMPKLGLTMKEGKIIKWHKKEGDRVEKDDILFEVETEKITNDVVSTVSGIVKEIVVPEDETVPVTETVAYIEEKAGEGPEEEETVNKAGETAKEEVRRDGSQERISPLARKIAEDNNIDLSAVKGTGLGGMVTKNDILKIVESKKGDSPESVVQEDGDVAEMSLQRRRTAERLSQMHRETPHVTITTPVDLTNTIEVRDRLKEKIAQNTGKKITYTHIFAKAVSMAIKEINGINSRLVDNKILYIQKINLGIAVDIDDALIVPVVKDTGEKSLTDLVETMFDLMERAKNKKLSLDDITGGTFTISNLGVYDVDFFTPLINPPECAILGIGRLFKRAWVVNDAIEIRPIATFSLTFDHRIVDGALAARFLGRVKQILETPGDIPVQ